MTEKQAVVEDFVAVTSRTSLVGFAKICLPSGVIFHNVAIHQQGSETWAAPSRALCLDRNGQQQRDADGKSVWLPVVTFSSKQLRDKFSAMVIAALKARHPQAFGNHSYPQAAEVPESAVKGVKSNAGRVSTSAGV